MNLNNYGITILRENCITFAERQELRAVMESSAAQLDATMVSKLYKSAIDKSHVFDTFEDSKGDITKFDGYANMKESLSILASLGEKSGVTIKELNTINTAIRILEGHKEAFMKGFLIENELVKMIYNTVLMGCVEGTSIVISSYVDFLRSVDKTEVTVVKTSPYTETTIKNLELFVASSNKGELQKILREATSNRDNFLGASAATVTLSAAMVGAAISIVPLLRELAFLFYYTRSRLSDYLEQQALLVEINSKNLDSSTLPLAERKKVAKRQQEKVQQFRRMADKVKYDVKKGTLDANTAIKAENKTWTIEETKDQMIRDTSNDFQLL